MPERQEFPHILPEGPDRRHAVLETVDLPAPVAHPSRREDEVLSEPLPSSPGPLDTQDFSRPEEVVSAVRAPLPAALAPPAPAEWRPVIPGYDVQEEIGRGLTGIVYRARQLDPDRLVALKVQRAGFLDPGGLESLREALRVEAEALADLRHPHIVQVYEVGEAAGQCWIALEYCGGTLAEQLDGHPWPALSAARLIATLAGAVQAAHQRGIFHGDLKPANVLLTDDGRPKITDFCVGARLQVLDRHRVDRGAGVMGTPAYMAPEQAQGRNAEVGPAADVHALGVLLYELLTGRLPFRAATVLETVGQVIRDEAVPPRQRQANVPPQLEAICLKCLRKLPGERYASARDLAAALERFLRDRPVADELSEYLEQRSASARALRAREGQLKGILQGVTDGVVVLDAGGRVVQANAVAERLFGGPLVGLSLEEWAARDRCFQADQVTPCPAADLPPARALRGETVAEVELFVRPASRNEGMWLGVRAQPLPGEHGRPGGAVAVIRDVPGQHLSLYRSLVEELRLCVFRKDLEGRYTFANDRFCRTLGLAREQVLGRTDEDLFTPEFAAKVRRDDVQILAHPAVAENIEEHLRSDCGPRCRCGGGLPAGAVEQGEERRWLQVLLAPVFDAEGRLAGTQGTFWDVTPRGRAERQAQEALAELRKTVAELARSNADLEQFAYVASHDLQEPLRDVAIYTQLLQKRYQGRLDADADEFIGYVVGGAARMKRLIDDLLLYSRVTAPGRMGRVSAQKALEDALHNLRAALRETDAQVTGRPNPLPDVWADATQLTQVFQNLIGNAVKFCRDRRPVVRVSACLTDREWRFSVRDNGIGIEPRHRERIFAIFQRLHPREQYPGTGMGLALCKKIVERHGGRIWVESSVGWGSTFSFTLPERADEED